MRMWPCVVCACGAGREAGGAGGNGDVRSLFTEGILRCPEARCADVSLMQTRWTRVERDPCSLLPSRVPFTESHPRLRTGRVSLQSAFILSRRAPP